MSSIGLIIRETDIYPPADIQLFQPDMGPREAQAAARVVQSGWLGRGPETEAFEAEFAAHLGVGREHVLALPSCTDALFLAVGALGLQPGDEVILPSVSFVGAGQAVLAAGGRPVLCDVEPRSLNPRIEEIAARLTPRTRAVLLLHYGGVPCADLGLIAARLEELGVALIEDGACSPASRMRGKACGTFGRFAAWSFDAMKLMSSGEGGMFYARDAAELRELRPRTTLGMSVASGLASGATQRWWEFDVHEPARRSLYCDLLAAVGRVQLSRLEEMVERRGEIVRHYRKRLSRHGAIALPPSLPSGAVPSDYFFWIQLDGLLRDALALHLRRGGIYSSFRYYPLHRMALFRDERPFPGADRAADTTLNLPLHSRLTAEEVDRVCDAIDEFMAMSVLRADRASAPPRAA